MPSGKFCANVGRAAKNSRSRKNAFFMISPVWPSRSWRTEPRLHSITVTVGVVRWKQEKRKVKRAGLLRLRSGEFRPGTTTKRAARLGRRALQNQCWAGLKAAATKAHYGEMARTRRGLPEPLTILRGAAMTTAPVGGSWSRLQR